MYSNFCCSCSFKPEIIKIGQSSHKMYSNNILHFQESTTILNACTQKSGNLLKEPHMQEQKSVFFLGTRTEILKKSGEEIRQEGQVKKL